MLAKKRARSKIIVDRAVKHIKTVFCGFIAIAYIATTTATIMSSLKICTSAIHIIFMFHSFHGLR